VICLPLSIKIENTGCRFNKETFHEELRTLGLLYKPLIYINLIALETIEFKPLKPNKTTHETITTTQ